MPIIISKPEFLRKNEDNVIVIDKAAIKAIPIVASHNYFRKQKNWKHIILNFTSLPENQIEVVLFDAPSSDTPSGILRCSPRARNQWEIHSIVLHDFDNGFLEILRDDLPAVDLDFIFDSRYSQPDLNANLQNKSSAVLTWNQVEETGPDTEYIIYRKVGNGQFTQLTTVTGSLNHTDTGLQPETTYTYKVEINDLTKYLPPTDEEAVTPGRPPVPAALTATGSTGQITLNWNAVAGSGITYRVYRSTTASNSNPTLIFQNLTQTSYIDNTVTNGQIYYYTVRSYDGFESFPSNEVAYRTIGNFSITDFSALSESSAKLTWEVAPGASQYAVHYRIKNSNNPYTIVANAASPYTLSGLQQGKDYEAYIRASNGYMTKDTPVTNAGMPVMPDAPTNLVAQSFQNAKSDLTWDSMPDADKYYIYRSTSETSGFTKIGESETTAYTSSPLSNGTTYYFRVTSVNIAGAITLESPYTQTSGKPDNSTPIVDMFLTDNTPITEYREGDQYSFRINFLQAIPSSVTKMEITLYSKAGVELNKWTSGSGVNTFQGPFISLLEETEYAAIGKATLVGGSVITSKTRYIRSHSKKPLNMAAQSSSVVRLTWATTGAGNYAAYRSTSQTGPFPSSARIYGYAGNSGSYTDASGNPGVTYYYCARKTGNTGWSGTNLGTPEGSGGVYTARPSIEVSSPPSTIASGLRTPLATPTNLVADSDSANAAKLTWDVVPGAEKYRVQASLSDTFETIDERIPSNQHLTIVGGRATFTISGITPGGRTWYFRVRADDNYTFSNYSNTDPAYVPPHIPTIKVYASDTKLTWNGVPTFNNDTVDWELQYGTTSAMLNSVYPFNPNVAWNNPAILSGLTPSTKYWVRLKERISNSYTNTVEIATFPSPVSLTMVMNSTSLRPGESLVRLASNAPGISFSSTTSGLVITTTNTASNYNDTIRGIYMYTTNVFGNLHPDVRHPRWPYNEPAQEFDVEVTYDILQSDNVSDYFSFFSGGMEAIPGMSGGTIQTYIRAAQPASTYTGIWTFKGSGPSRTFQLISGLYSYATKTNKIRIISWKLISKVPVI